MGVPRKEAVSAASLAPLCVRLLGWEKGLAAQRLSRVWEQVSGAGAFTVKAWLKDDGTYYVTLSSSMVRSQLEFQKAALLKALNEALASDGSALFDPGRGCLVKRLVFR